MTEGGTTPQEQKADMDVPEAGHGSRLVGYVKRVFTGNDPSDRLTADSRGNSTGYRTCQIRPMFG